MRQNMIKLLILFLPALASPVWSQTAESEEQQELDWQASFVSGWFTGGTWLQTEVDGEPVSLKTDDGLLAGLRIGVDQEFLGLEATLAGVFYDAHLEADPAALGLPSVSDASLLLLGINALVFPTGNELVEGRVKPYITAGKGLAILYSDFDKADGEVMSEFNVGGGVKFLLGDDGKTVFRIDWRWHYLDGKDAGLRQRIYHQELTLGLGIRF